MSVNIQLINPSYHSNSFPDGGLVFQDGEPLARSGPRIHAYKILENGVLTILVNLMSDGERTAFDFYHFGPNAWASVFGTAQHEIDAMDDEELEAEVTSAGRIWNEVALMNS